MNTTQDLERLVAAIESQGANIAPTYQEYMPLAFAIANDCGEEGRALFHRVCRLSEKYQSDEADKLFTHALCEGRGRNGIGSVFHLAHMAGVRLDKPLNDISKRYPREVGKGKAEQPEKLSNFQSFTSPLPSHTRTHEETLPEFPDYPWPPFLRQLIDQGDTPAQRDILLLGAITVLGATLNKRLRVLYGRKFQYPCLQTFVVAPPASGKGALTWVRRLAEPIHEAMMTDYQEKYKVYRTEKSQWLAQGKERANTPEPEMPPLKMFLIAGDNSGTGVLENLIDAEGVGLICETEADTVSAAIGTEYGHWSDTLRKCHDHDRLAFNRRTNHEYRECKRSFLSVLLSGTPAQVRPLIPSAENGLFSRQLFYYMPPINEWADQFDLGDEDLDQRFAHWGCQWKRLVDTLTRTVSVVQLKLDDGQKERFNAHFAQIFGHACFTHGNPMRSSVARIAINVCRITSVVALLRAVEGVLPTGDSTGMPLETMDNATLTGTFLGCPGLSPAPGIHADNLRDGIVTTFDLHINDNDFQAVLSLVEPLYRHSTHILTLLPPSETVRQETSPQAAVFDALPLTFSRRQATEEAERNGMPINTLDTCLGRMLEKGILIKLNRGEYAFNTHTRMCVSKTKS